MTKEQLLKRYQDLAKSMQESVENHTRLKTALDNATHAHNVLVGRVEEAYYLHKEAEKEEEEVLKKEQVTSKK